MTVVTIRGDGNGVSLTLPEETRQRLGLEEGQLMTVLDLPDGVTLLKHAPKTARQMDLAREVLAEQADVLRELAKR